MVIKIQLFEYEEQICGELSFKTTYTQNVIEKFITACRKYSPNCVPHLLKAFTQVRETPFIYYLEVMNFTITDEVHDIRAINVANLILNEDLDVSSYCTPRD
jgi:hypothetical protein